MERNQNQCQRNDKEKMKKFQYNNSNTHESNAENSMAFEGAINAVPQKNENNSQALDGDPIINNRRKSQVVVDGNGYECGDMQRQQGYS